MTLLEEQRLRGCKIYPIKRVKPEDARVEEHDFIPGEITKTLGEVEIAFKDGFLIPKIIQVGTWGIFDIKDFIEKFSPRIGERINGNG